MARPARVRIRSRKPCVRARRRLLLVAVACFAHGRVVLASAVAALAGAFHSTYLLPAGLLVFGFLYELTRDRTRRTGVY